MPDLSKATQVIFFFYGPNSYAARQQIAKMVAEYQKKSGSDLGIERIDGARTIQADLVSALQASPFLANSRLVIVENLGTNKAVDISKITVGIPKTTVAVFYDSEADQRTAYFKLMAAAGKAIKFQNLSIRELHNWVKQEVEAQEAEIDGPAVTKLVEIAGEDQWRLKNEIAKLALHDKRITLESIAQMVVSSQADNIFDLVEAMSSGNSKAALELYHSLRLSQVNDMYILTMIIWQLRNLLLAKLAGSVSPEELAGKTGMSPFVAGKMLTRGRDLEESVIKGAFLEAVEVDYGIKTGQGAADALIEQLLLKIAGRVTQG